MGEPTLKSDFYSSTSAQPSNTKIHSLKVIATKTQGARTHTRFRIPEYFKYLAALDNHCKHRGIVDIGFSVNAIEGTHGMRINAFSYEGTDYPQRCVRPLLNAEYQRQETQIMLAGNHLNDYVASLL